MRKRGLRTEWNWLRFILPILLLAVLAPLEGFAERVRVATINVRNYNECSRFIRGEWMPDYPKPEEEKEALRAILRSVDADVVLLQEIGGEAYLAELNRDMAAEDLAISRMESAGEEGSLCAISGAGSNDSYYPYKACLVGLDPVRCLGVLSRIPIEEVVEHNRLKFTIHGKTHYVRRGLLGVKFVSQSGIEWTAYNVHLKSRYGSDKDPEGNEREREGEAQAVRNRILKDHDNIDEPCWVLLGDMNDTPGSGTWERFRHKGSYVFAKDLRARDENGETWTYFYSREDTYERIDALFSSVPMMEYCDQSRAHIYSGDNALEASDHRMVYMDVDFPDTESEDLEEVQCYDTDSSEDKK